MVILVAVLIFTMIYQLLIRPIQMDYSDVSDRVDLLQMQYEDMTMRSLDYALYQGQYDEQLQKSAVITKDLLPPTTSDALDKSIIRLVLASGLSVKSLVISSVSPHSVKYKPGVVGESDEAVVTQEEAVEYQTGVSQCDLIYTVNGTYASILALIRSVNENPSMCVSALEFANIPPQDGSATIVNESTQYEATVVISVYMYEAVVEQPESSDATEETDAAQ